MFPSADFQPKGLLATEGVVTIPFAGATPVAVRSHYFEFVDGGGTARRLPELAIGSDYDVVMTTAGGLWRYRLRDRVRVTGFVYTTPCLQFIGKNGLISDRFGEKLSDAFVAGALQAVFKRHGINPAFAMLAPDTEGNTCGYTLYVEHPVALGICAELDAALRLNPNYAYCRNLGQLKTPRIYVFTKSGFDIYSARMMKIGMKLGDIKPCSLSSLDQWSEVFPGFYCEGFNPF